MGMEWDYQIALRKKEVRWYGWLVDFWELGNQKEILIMNAKQIHTNLSDFLEAIRKLE